jgi:hypothetical protein
MALEGDSNVIETVVQMLSQHDGLSHMTEVVRILLNEAIESGRAQCGRHHPHAAALKKGDLHGSQAPGSAYDLRWD